MKRRFLFYNHGLTLAFLCAVMVTFLMCPLTTLAQETSHDHTAEHDHDPGELEGQNHEGDHEDQGHDKNAEEHSLDDPECDHEGHEHDDEVDHDDHEGEGLVEVTPEGMKLAGITLATVTRGRIDRSVDLPGEVGFDEDCLVHIAPRFSGIAREARFRVGDYVQAGDVVAVVESNESLNPYAIKALMSGWIIERHVSPGEFVSGEYSIYVIADLSNVWVNLAVYPKDADRIKPGQNVSIEAIGSTAKADGTIQYVTPVFDVRTRSITARVVLPNPNKTWRPGAFVQARVTTESGEEGLVVENDAIQVLDNEPVVFVPVGEGRFKPVPIELGDSDSRYTKICSGLELGTEYVATGAFELKAKIVTSALGGHAGHGH